MIPINMKLLLEPSEQPENIIIEEIRKGYQLKGRPFGRLLSKCPQVKMGRPLKDV